MSKAKETIKAIQKSHSALFVVAATAIALLFTSPTTVYREALKEAYVLRALRMSEYENFARSATPGNYMLPMSDLFAPGAWTQEITKFLSTKLGWKVHSSSFPRHEIRPILRYAVPPTSGAVKDWFDWISSTENVKYWHPEWSGAKLSISRDVPETAPIVRYFTVKPSTFRRSPGEYTFRAYLDLNVTEKDLSPYGHFSTDCVDDWWSSIAALDTRELWHRRNKDSPLLRKGQFVVEGDVDSELRDGSQKSGIRNWLESSGEWAKLSRTNDLGETVLPGMRAHWSEISDKSLDGAIGFMEQKMAEIQDVNVFGILVPGRLCAIAIPIAFLVVTLQMLLNARHLSTIKEALTADGIDDSPWIGLHSDLLASRVTDYSLLLVPVGLSLAVIVKYHGRVDLLTNAIGFGFVIITLVCSLALVIKVREVRASIAPKVIASQQKAPDSR